MSFKLRKMESIAVIVGTIVTIIVVIYQFIQTPSPKPPDEDKPPIVDKFPRFAEISDITSAMKGEKIDTRGIVTDLTEGKGHVFFSLKDPKTGKKIRCVLFAKTNNADPNRKNILLRSRDKNSVVNIRGEVNIYNGELQIKVWEVTDVDAEDEPATSNKPLSFVEVSQINAGMVGMIKNTRGIVTILNENKGHVYFNLKDPKTGKEIRCVMFAKTNNDNSGRKDLLLRSRDNNSVVNIKGKVDEYKGELEIIVWQVYL